MPIFKIKYPRLRKEIGRAGEREADMWYAIQTMTGNEEEAMESIRRLVDKEIYEECFLLKREAVWRIQGACRVYVELLFPGYVFVSTKNPEELYQQLKRVSFYTKMLGKEGEEFYPVSLEEESFLKELINEDEEYTVRLSPVKVDEQGNIVECRKPLDGYMDRVIKKRIRMRYVIIRVHLFGRDREILLGLRLEGD